jgi:phosphatidate cytidylyltransferase
MMATPGGSGEQARQPRGQGRPRQPRRQGRPRSDLAARVLVAIPAGIVAILFVSFGGLAFTLFMIAVGCVCIHELFRLLARWRPVAPVGFAAVAGLCLAARFGGRGAVLEVALACLPVVFLVVLFRGRPAGSTVAIAGTLLGIFWIGLPFAHAVLLRDLPHGAGVMIDVLLGTFLGDTGAYLGGRMFGRRPLAPSVSPNKTTEGLYIGMLVAIVTVIIAGLYESYLDETQALLLGVAVAVLGPLGDLFESVVKREAGTKDAGTLFGAHGGALDRLDAVIFTIVAGYYIWAAVVHV